MEASLNWPNGALLTVFLAPQESGRGTSWRFGALDNFPEPVQSLI